MPIPHPTNMALFGHKITLYRFNQGGSYYCRVAEPPPLTLTTDYGTNLVSDVVDGKHGAGDRLMGHNRVKIGSGVVTARGTGTSPIDWFKVLRVFLVLQLQLSGWNKSHAKPLHKTQSSL